MPSIITGGLGPAGGVTRFVMRAYKTTPTTGYVYWTVKGSPDLTGSQSPYNPADLTDIIIALTERTIS